MADVKIRKLPDWVVVRHKRTAELAGHSLEEELRTIITETALEKRRYWDRRLGKLRAEIRRKHGTLPDSTSGIRAERDRRG
jgi:plasmid stability protein